jgi:hypothetical protein
MEYRGTGRVKLSEFYKPALDGSWQFQESVAYLRQIGALDESDPNDASVLIANYLHSQTNCIASSGFYSVCCKDECEGLLGHFERELASSDATPEAIVKIAEALPSSSVSSPRELSSTLVNRLDDIAAQHDRLVPLHGRLFAQWMHNAYPRECPYPHVSGTVSNMSPDEWLDETASEAIASEEEMNRFLKSGNATSPSTDDLASDEALMPWSPEEELLVVRTLPRFVPESESPQKSAMSNSLRSVVLLALAISMALSLVQSLKTSSGQDSMEVVKNA